MNQFWVKVIITSKLWGTVLSEIQNDDSCSKKFLIIGSPLDLAIAANTKFNVLFTQGSHGDKLKLIFGMYLYTLVSQTLKFGRFNWKQSNIFYRKNKNPSSEKNANHLLWHYGYVRNKSRIEKQAYWFGLCENQSTEWWYSVCRNFRMNRKS